MKTLLRQNAELKKDRIWNWSIPAWVTILPDNRAINACPEAGACIKVCYARNGTYRFPKVLESHQRNLMLAMDTPDEFVRLMNAELAHKRFDPTGVPRHVEGLESTDHLHPWVQQLLGMGAAVVRIHDTGDFFSADYLAAWIDIALANPGIIFYSYTKSVQVFRNVAEGGGAPANFLWCYSLGGKQDHLLDLDVDRHADVFPDADAIEAAGYADQTANDLLCVLHPNHRIGIPTNNIPAFRKRQGDRTFGQMEAELTRHGRTLSSDR